MLKPLQNGDSMVGGENEFNFKDMIHTKEGETMERLQQMRDEYTNLQGVIH